ncbi:MAG: hypothetical protein PHQ91_08305 [Thermoanaerobaculaceae bacterium]|nr:hypothetical protein [Thermoanaerobaculaceae bacterium]TAM45170.1 MAG: hypothetical protein EPN53_15100 [Acidobacteriota bacterium]
MSAPTPQDARHELLEPYLQRLRAFFRARGDENRPLTIPSEPSPLALSAEERKAVWSVLCDETVAWSDAGAWIPLGAGLHLAVAAALEGAVRADAADAPAPLGAIRAVAAGYTEALREAIAAMVGAGRSEEAKLLSGFRNKLLGILTALRTAGDGSAAHPTPARPDDRSADPPPGASGDATVSVDAATAPDPALTPYLQRAAAFLRARGHEERPLAVSFGRRTLSLSAWERRVLWQSLCEGKAPVSDWHRMIPECVAVQLALLLSLDELERAGPSAGAGDAARSTLHAVVQLAAGVVEGFRTQVERAVGAGALDDAKHLASLSSAFATTLIEARRALVPAPAGVATIDGGSGGGAAAAPPEPAPARAGAAPAGPPDTLKPFLERAATLLEVRGHEDRPLSIPVGGKSWNLNVWERQVLWKVWCEEGPPPPEWSTLVGYGAAVQLAALLALERLTRATAAPEARSAVEADRAAALELGSEIGERMRATAEALAADGQVKLAERLTRSRASLTESIQLLQHARVRPPV